MLEMLCLIRLLAARANRPALKAQINETLSSAIFLPQAPLPPQTPIQIQPIAKPPLHPVRTPFPQNASLGGSR
jgi:hypothetical protein